MPITINYTPIGLSGLLAAQSGQNAANRANQTRADELNRTAFSQNLQSAQLSLQQQTENNRVAAQERAFSLQEAALADKERAEAMKTPAADHIAERVNLARANRQNQQSQDQAQLDSLLSDGTIDQAQYQKGKMAILTGNRELMNQILATPKANISTAQDLSMLRQKYGDRRKTLQTKYAATMRQTYGDDAVAKVNTQFNTDLAALTKEEDDAVEGLRAGSNKTATTRPTYSEDSFLVDNGDTTTNAMPGAVSRRPPPGSATTQPATQPNDYGSDQTKQAPWVGGDSFSSERRAKEGADTLGGNIPSVKGADDPLYHALPGGTYYRRPDGTMAQKSMVGSSPAIQKLTGKTSQDIIVITGDDDPLFDALPAGSLYRGPDGVVRKK